MKMTVFNLFEVEGNEMECALYTCIMIEALRMKKEHDDKKELDEWMTRFGNMTFEELLRHEREGDEDT